jgi:predicted ATPase
MKRNSMKNGQGGQHVALSGCSGGGESTLPAEVASRGFETGAEPGRTSCSRS